jgi:hypothetical protein
MSQYTQALENPRVEEVDFEYIGRDEPLHTLEGILMLAVVQMEEIEAWQSNFQDHPFHLVSPSP